MICPKCQSQISDNSVFCDKCGCRLSDYAQNALQQDADTAPNPAGDSGASQNNFGMSQPVNNTKIEEIPAQGFGGQAEPNAFGQPANGFVPNADMGNTQPPQTEAPFTSLPQGYVAPINNKPKKSIKKALPFIIGGGVIAIAVAAFCCVKFAAADIAHTFMGDEKYAASLFKGTLDSVQEQGDAIEKGFSSGLSSASGNTSDYSAEYDNFIKENPDSEITYSQYVQVKSAGSAISAIGSALPENGLYVKYGVKSELSDSLYQLVADASGVSVDEAKEVLDSLSGLSVEGKFSIKEDGLDAGYLIAQNDTELDRGNIYYNTDEGMLFYSNPSIYGSALSQKLMPMEIEIGKKTEESESKVSDEARKELFDEIISIYKEHLENAETEYSSVTESMGEAEFKGKSMKVTFSGKELSRLIKDMAIAVVDSDYFENLMEAAYNGELPENFDIVDLKDQIEEAFDKMEDSDSKLSLDIEHFINADNSVAGFRISLSGKSGGEKQSVGFSYLGDSSNYYIEVELNGTKLVKCEGTKTSDNSGTAEINITIPSTKSSKEAQKLKINVEYSDISTKEFLGSNTALGKFTFTLGGNIFDGIGTVTAGEKEIELSSIIKNTAFTVSASDKDRGIEYQVEIKNETYGTIGYTLEIGENTEPVSDRAGMTANESVDLSGDSAELVDVKIGILKHLQDIYGKSGFVKGILDSAAGESFDQQAQTTIDMLEKNKKYIAVYSEYDGYNTVYDANDNAYYIYSALYGEKPASKKPLTIKLYFDNSGNMNIIDMAGEDESILDSVRDSIDIKNAYVEITYFLSYNSYAPLGVTVVMTDSKDHHCEGLPTVYNYIDEVYSWSGDENYIGDYVVGTYPNLDKGESTFEQKIEELKAAVPKYNEYAKKGFDTFKNYLNSTNNSFDLGSYITHDAKTFKIESGEWSNYQGIYSFYFKNDINTDDLYDYMKANASDIPDGYLTLYITDNNLVAASFCEEPGYIFGAPLFTVGVTSAWSYDEGIYDNLAMGTYPVLKEFDGTVPDNVKKFMVGTWVKETNEDTEIIITEEDVNCITEILPHSSGYISVKFVYEDGSRANVYLNMIDRMEFDYVGYIKK